MHLRFICNRNNEHPESLGLYETRTIDSKNLLQQYNHKKVMQTKAHICFCFSQKNNPPRVEAFQLRLLFFCCPARMCIHCIYSTQYHYNSIIHNVLNHSSSGSVPRKANTATPATAKTAPSSDRSVGFCFCIRYDNGSW